MSVGLMPWSVAKSDEPSRIETADSATRPFGNYSLSAGVIEVASREREREMSSLWVIRVQSTLGRLLVVMRLCCFDSSMELALSCRSAEIEAATSSSCCCKCFSRCEISRLRYCVQLSVGCAICWVSPWKLG
jgi:hypothetical protein